MAAQPGRVTPIFVEKRFPLNLSGQVDSIRELYDAAKAACWNPQLDIPWDRFQQGEHAPEVLQAAGLSWSRRAWSEYTSLPETPSLLIRFCVEEGREADPKYFLTVRNTEEAWHVESCHRFASITGGYVDQPGNAEYARLFNGNLHREALDADNSLDGYVAAHCAVEDGLELALWRGYLDNARDAVAQRLLQLCVADKERHAAFGWLYLEQRAPAWDSGARDAVRDAIAAYVTGIELRGYHCAWLAGGDSGREIVAADEVTARAGLGALEPGQEREILRQFFAGARTRLDALGITLPPFDDPRTGEF